MHVYSASCDVDDNEVAGENGQPDDAGVNEENVIVWKEMLQEGQSRDTCLKLTQLCLRMS